MQPKVKSVAYPMKKFIVVKTKDNYIIKDIENFTSIDTSEASIVGLDKGEFIIKFLNSCFEK